MAHTTWRIDDFARHTGVSVDTIRFWQRLGLLPPPKRSGRTSHYDLAHAERVQQIRDLQSRHLSLAAIKQLLDSSRAVLADSLFSGSGGDHTQAGLARESGLSLDLVQELQAVGMLQDPERLGRESYDDADLRMLVAVRGLLDAGLPRTFVVRLGQIYAAGFIAMQREVFELFTKPNDLSEEELLALQEELAGDVTRVLRPVETLLEYRHQRTLQAMTVATVRREAVQRDRQPG